MQQCALWHETRLDALAADVQASGGPKKVGHRLWPALDPSIAAAKLRACLNPEQAQKLSDDEEDLVMEIAGAHGADFTMQYLGRRHGYKVERLNPKDAKKRAKRARRLALLSELRELENEDEES
jgi:hypothetical protein